MIRRHKDRSYTIKVGVLNGKLEKVFFELDPVPDDHYDLLVWLTKGYRRGLTWFVPVRRDKQWFRRGDIQLAVMAKGTLEKVLRTGCHISVFGYKRANSLAKAVAYVGKQYARTRWAKT